MMLFRAIRESNNEFVYGFVTRPAKVEDGKAVLYYFNAINHFPNIEDAHFWVSEVIVFADFIERCTGEYDKTGKQLVFEGDVLQADDCRNSQLIVKFGKFVPSNIDSSRFPVGNLGFYVESKENSEFSDLLRPDILFWLPMSKVIGNIHNIRSYSSCEYCEHFDYIHYTCPYCKNCFSNNNSCAKFEIYKCDIAEM